MSREKRPDKPGDKPRDGPDHGYRQRFFSGMELPAGHPDGRSGKTRKSAEDARLFDTHLEAGPPCFACGAPTVIKDVVESMPAGFRDRTKIECTRCRAWRWDNRPKASR